MKMIMIITGLTFVVVCAYLSFFGTLWFLAGACWGLINLYFIKQLLYELLISNPKSFLKIALLTLIKFPVLYGIGFGLLYYQDEPFWALLAGFSAVLALNAQKKLWHAFQSQENKGMA